MADSSKPPSEEIPGAPQGGGGGPYIVGIVVLVALAGGLFFWKRSTASGPSPAPVTTTILAAKPTVAPDLPVFAPPPPPKLDDEPDASVEDAGKPTGKTGTAVGGGPCSTTCTGQGTPALNAALTAHGRSAQGCYNRALQHSEVSGSMRVSVHVGPGGQVCSASIVEDSVRSAEVTSCVISRFSGQTFPPPSGGCVRVNIPISFTIKQ